MIRNFSVLMAIIDRVKAMIRVPWRDLSSAVNEFVAINSMIELIRVAIVSLNSSILYSAFSWKGWTAAR